MTTEHGTAMVIVSHDLIAIEATCDRVVVLDGVIVEDLPASHLRTGATHPLTRELIASYPTDPVAHPQPDRKDPT
jgi:peptide/nickel transport system ATP-binding protein